MSELRPRSAFAPAIALCGLLAVAYLGLGSIGSDYATEAMRSVQALLAGDLARFAGLAPPYGGSLLLRAPFALLASLCSDGSPLAVYRALAVPCLLAAGALGLWTFSRIRAEGARPLTAAVALLLFTCNPILLPALEYGHPEEILCAVLCVAAVLLARRERPALAGLALGVAIGCKYWPIAAIGPVMLALPRARRQCLLTTVLSAGALLAPMLVDAHFVAASAGAASPSSAIFQPWQVFWFLGSHRGAFDAANPGYRIPPGWVGPISHPLLIGLALFAAAALWWARLARRSATGVAAGDPLLLLVLCMLLRCLFDTLDNVYYTLPFLFALLAWECEAFSGHRPPLLAICATALCWASFETLPALVSADAQSAFFLAWTAPLAVVLGIRLYAPHPTPILPRSPVFLDSAQTAGGG